ncbi:MAG: hypothetical protein COT18_08675 [Elusimicrobia bacterium CG08_land_8_20_14_0_20_59_10]|nr:MAG: hypothetical protein COT18_08675 [Elusimicrobia bacterium CG08_land_8_20_14_0_20_59_10]
MSISVTCACGAVYNLKDEYAGSQVACPKCGASLAVPALPPAPAVNEQQGDAAFARDKFLLNQRHLSIKEKYSVVDEEGNALMYMERPRYLFLNTLAIFGGIIAGAVNYLLFSTIAYSVKDSMPPLAILFATLGTITVMVLTAMGLSKKRHLTVYRDDSRTEVLLKILQDRKIQIITAGYTVTDPQDQPIAYLTKNYLYNILRKRWYCYNAGRELIFTAKEDSIILSILRRFLGSFFGLLRTDFIFFAPDESVLGEFNRRMTLLDRYVLDMSPDSLRKIDRRVALAAGVLLDTGEKR